MKRAYANRGVGHKRKPSERRAKREDANRQVQFPLDRDELLALMQDSLESLAVERRVRQKSRWENPTSGRDFLALAARSR